MAEPLTASANEDVFATFIRRIVRPERSFYKVVIVYGIAISLLTLAVPLSVQILINSVSNTALPQSLAAVIGMLGVLLALYSTLNALQLYVMELFERRFFTRVATEVADLRLQNPHTPAQTPFNRFFEVMHVQKSVPSLMVGGYSLFLQTVVGLAVVSFYHPFLLLFTLLLVLACLMSWRIRHRGALAGAIAVSEEKYAVADWLEHIEHAPTAARRVQEAVRSEALMQRYLTARRQFFRYSFTQTILFLITYVLASVSLLGIGGMLVIHGQLSLGQLVAAELILSAILLGLSKLGYYLALYYEICAAALKLEALLTDNGTVLPPAPLTEGRCLWRSIRVTAPLRLMVRITQVFLLLLVLGLSFVPWVQTAFGTGSVTALDPGGQQQSIHALVKGRIKQWFVRDGSLVRQGDPILEIVDNDPLLLERLEAEAESARKALEAIRAGAQTAKLDLTRKQELYESGIASRREMEQAKIDYMERQAKEAEAIASVAVAETKLSRQHTQLVRAPKDGLIARTASGDLATLVKEGDVLATFIPSDSRRAVELYVSGMDMPLVYPGRKVRLQFEGWPMVQFSGWPSTAIGTFAGEVQVVAPAVSPNGKFRLLITEPEGEPWPDNRYLRMGAKANGWVLLDTVPLGYELWRQMNGFPPENPDLRPSVAGHAPGEEKK